MTSGICFPSLAWRTTWTITGGAANVDFPVTNLTNLDEIRKVFVANAAGAVNILFTFPELQSIDFFAFLHHNADQAATFRLRVSAGLDATVGTLYDSGVSPFWMPGTSKTRFASIRPVLLPAPVTIRSAHIQLSAMAAPWEIGGVDVGRFWPWNVEVNREIGLDTRSTSSSSGSIEHVTQQWAPRVVSGQRELVTQNEVDMTFLDFQKTHGLNRPFVWVSDIEDPLTWGREAMLVTNNSLPAGRAVDYDQGKMSFAFREHLR